MAAPMGVLMRSYQKSDVQFSALCKAYWLTCYFVLLFLCADSDFRITSFRKKHKQNIILLNGVITRRVSEYILTVHVISSYVLHSVFLVFCQILIYR